MFAKNKEWNDILTDWYPGYPLPFSYSNLGFVGNLGKLLELYNPAPFVNKAQVELYHVFIC